MCTYPPLSTASTGGAAESRGGIVIALDLAILHVECQTTCTRLLLDDHIGHIVTPVDTVATSDCRTIGASAALENVTS